jgi:pimeloyl-ACP methyl ester carboxylesterase
MQREARSPDGESLGYEVHGPASGRAPIITVHGLVSSIHHWQFFLPAFSRDRPVLSWEYRGHGGHPPPRDCTNASVDQFAADGIEVWRASGLPAGIVTGLSYGVQVALEVWRQAPERVRALVLICGTAGRPLDRISGSPRLRDTLAGAMRTLAGQPVLAAPLLAFLRSSIGTRIAREVAYATGGAKRDACPPEVLQGLFAHVGGLDPRLLGCAIAGYLEHDGWDVLPTIRVPTLIIAGDKDQLTPVETSERMQALVPGSELVVFPGHSHLVQVEKPGEVHDAIERFLSKHGL